MCAGLSAFRFAPHGVNQRDTPYRLPLLRSFRYTTRLNKISSQVNKKDAGRLVSERPMMTPRIARVVRSPISRLAPILPRQEACRAIGARPPADPAEKAIAAG